MAILLVEHDVALVMQVCDWIHVLDFERSSPPARRRRCRPPRCSTPTSARAHDRRRMQPQPPPRPRPRCRCWSPGTHRLRADRGAARRRPRCPEGRWYALLGPNGGGKSTTLKAVSGQLPATGGCIHLAGRHVNGAGADELARIGVCTHPGGAGHLPEPDRAENLRMVTFAGTADLEQVEGVAYERFPRLGERRTAGQDDVRRRAADAGAGTQPGRRPRLAAPRRAVDGPRPADRPALYEIVADVAAGGVSILVEQFAQPCSGSPTTPPSCSAAASPPSASQPTLKRSWKAPTWIRRPDVTRERRGPWGSGAGSLQADRSIRGRRATEQD